MSDKKNFSFYMPDDFIEKIESVQANNEKLKGLSRSQALYFIVSNIADDLTIKDPTKEEPQ